MVLKMKKLVIFFILVSLFFSSGCQYAPIASLLGTPGYYEQKIPAEYDLSEQKDQKILILVDQPGSVNSRVNMRYYLTESIRKNLVERIKITEDNLVGYSELFAFRSKREDFSSLSPQEVGKALGANLVLFVVIEDYQITAQDEGGCYNGSLRGQAALFDAATEEKLWPKTGKSKMVSVGFEFEARGQDVANARLINSLAYCTTRYLYNCPKSKFSIPDDRSGIGWESWKK